MSPPNDMILKMSLSFEIQQKRERSKAPHLQFKHNQARLTCVCATYKVPMQLKIQNRTRNIGKKHNKHSHEDTHDHINIKKARRCMLKSQSNCKDNQGASWSWERRSRFRVRMKEAGKRRQIKPPQYNFRIVLAQSGRTAIIVFSCWQRATGELTESTDGAWSELQVSKLTSTTTLHLWLRQ